jgi:hypothetical protein
LRRGLAGTDALEFEPAEDPLARCHWIARVLWTAAGSVDTDPRTRSKAGSPATHRSPHWKIEDTPPRGVGGGANPHKSGSKRDWWSQTDSRPAPGRMCLTVGRGNEGRFDAGRIERSPWPRPCQPTASDQFAKQSPN